MLALLTSLAAVLALTACGEKEDALGPDGNQRMTLMLDYFPNANHAGIYAAQAGGMFKQAGLDVTIRQPPDPAAPIKQVAAGRADLAISYEPEVLRARDQGLNVVAVGALVRKPLTSIISLPKGKIRSPRDLEGKTVGTAGIDYQAAFLRSILDRAGVDESTVKTRNLGFNLVGPLVSGKVDAIARGLLELRGRAAAPAEAQAAHHPGGARRCAHLRRAGPGGQRGCAGARRHAHPGLRRRARPRHQGPGARSRQGHPGLLKANPDLDPRLQRASVRVTLPLFLPAKGKPFGYQDPEEWQDFAGWMHDNKLTTRIPDANGAFDNRFLPGGGL